jgi:beta-galactosidase
MFGGAMHYFRTPAPYWEDRLRKLKALGCNTVETYVAWNAHERRKGRFDFSGHLDIEQFIQTADDLGLHVIVRPGPYICAEWDLGALPCWLLAEPMTLRCADPAYLRHVDEWFDVLMPRIVPHLTTQGGPVIAVQIENEYGYFGNDQTYLRHLGDGMVRRGVDVPLFTSDGAWQTITVENGGLDGHLRTANFGSAATERFKVLREVQPRGPLACMEFWVGWFDTWGDAKHHMRDAADTAKHLDELLAHENASVNIYMFHGGTNFGFTAGGNLQEKLCPYVTSYDYDALLNEWGDITPKYLACQRVLHQHQNKPVPSTSFAPVARRTFGSVSIDSTCSLSAALPSLSTPVRHAAPLSFEQLATGSGDFDGNGFVLYRTTLSRFYRDMPLLLRDMHDWCHILLDGRPVATWFRNDPMPQVKFDIAGDSATLDILVAHLARSNFGYRMTEQKGFVGAHLGGPNVNDRRTVFDWTHFGLCFERLSTVAFGPDDGLAGPRLWRGKVNVDTPADTFLHLPGFSMGCAFVNGFNLGRYWSVGPQQALYVPGTVLRSGPNEVVIFDAVGTAGSAKLLAEPALG